MLTSMLGLLIGLLPSGFPTKTLYDHASLFFFIRTTCPAHLIVFYLIIRINNIILLFYVFVFSPIAAACQTHFIAPFLFSEKYKLWSLILCNCLHCPGASFQDEIFLSTLFWNSLSCLRPTSLTVRDQVPDPYKTIGKVTELFILIKAFLAQFM